MYVAGGFDAHSMSTGEMIVPHVTSCIDCYSNGFKRVLKDYKPTYITHSLHDTMQGKNRDSIILGGSGSIAACSLFSASYACMNIIYHFLGLDMPKQNRGEYRINKGDISWVNIERNTNEKCQFCNP